MIPEMQEVSSTQISHRGFDAAANRLFIRFKKENRPNEIGALYSYENVTPDIYQQGIDYINPLTQRPSFGAWFKIFIKANPLQFPYTRLEDRRNGQPSSNGHQPKTETVDFASQQPIPAQAAADPLPQDRSALELMIQKTQQEAKAIEINSPQAYTFAESFASKIARLRDAWKRICAPDIEAAHQAHKAALAVFNNYEKPLAEDQQRLTSGMLLYKRKDDERRMREANQLREAEQKRIAAEAEKAAAKLHEEDTLAAIDRGDTAVAEVMIASKPLPLAAPIAPPVHVPSAIPQTGKSYAREKWDWEFVDRDGKPSQHPDLSLIPAMYLMVNEKAINNAVRDAKNLVNIPGVRVFPVGAISIRKK